MKSINKIKDAVAWKLIKLAFRYNRLLPRSINQKVHDAYKVRLIAAAMQTKEGLGALANAMIAPIKYGSSPCKELDIAFEKRTFDASSLAKCYDLIEQGIPNWESAYCIRSLHALAPTEEIKKKIALGIWKSNK